MDYRKEIDGLRAFAVLPVILFHAGMEVFSGGFVGVDIFFVISGYLITSIILAELEQNKFSIINFYERRARRILPALFFVIFTCLPLAWLSLLPIDLKSFSKSLIAVATFASNILFWQESGYFDPAAELKPLLHTWSLAVEEQYYVFFPLFLMFFWRFGKRWLIISLGLIFTISLIGAQLGAYTRPTGTFFLLPTRGWELLIGAFAAFYLSHASDKKFNKHLREIAGWFGIFLILYAVFSYDKNTPFPGFYALIPTIGAVLIILFATQETVIGKFIGNKLFVSIGLISYSAYLWHQPLFSFARHNGISSFEKSTFYGLIILTFLLAAFSWKFVEAPFRNKSKIKRNSVFWLSLLGTICLVSVGMYGQYKNGDLGQLTPAQRDFLNYFENEIPAWHYFTKYHIQEKYRTDCDFYDLASYRAGNNTKKPVAAISTSCFTKSNQAEKTIFIWGDSHAQQLYPGLKEALPAHINLLQVASSGCVAKIDAPKNLDNYCEYSNWFALNAIKKVKPDYVLIGQNSKHDINTMQTLATALKAVGIKKVLFTGPSPHWTPSLPAAIARTLPQTPMRSFFGIDREVLQQDQILKKASKHHADIQYVSLIDYFCRAEGCLVYYDPENIQASVTSWDYGHLTPVASYHFAKDVLIPLIMEQH